MKAFSLWKSIDFFCVNAVICDVAAHTVTDILGLEKRF